METAVVHRNLTDLNAEPNFLAERKTQALFGETLTIVKTQDEYALVRQTDGYEGWARSAAFTAVSTETGSAQDRDFWVVTDPVATVYDVAGEQAAPYFLTYGAHILPTGEAGRDEDVEFKEELVAIANPAGGALWIESEAISPMPCHRVGAGNGGGEGKSLAESILTATEELLGVPYLWGGRSSLGLDCSALVQLVYGLHGITLPRDSAEQCERGIEIAREELRPADLIFSPGHVVIYIGADKFIHASLGEGGVAINSYDPKANNYRADLDRDYVIARRLC
ncbi:C40 family peptidase [Gemmatimonas aurantiaca]|nr:C40 family peptidase [Gemmatimonas aurantiaca]